MTKPYVIKISSQKGGVGKTTVAVNLSAALSQMGYRLLLVDADTSNPSIGFHLGLDEVNAGIKDVMSGKAQIKNVVVTHNVTGMHVLPGTAYSKAFSPSREEAERLASALAKENYDFVVIDTAPGLPEQEMNRLCDEAVIITSPEMSSCSSCIKLASAYDKQKVKHNLVVNRFRNKRYEISMQEIEEMYGDRPRAIIPEDEVVPISVSEHIPAYILSPRAQFSANIRGLARFYAVMTGTPAYERTRTGTGIMAFLKRLLGLK